MSESKEDQWMGVTVQSQGPGGKVVVSIEKCTLLSVGWSWTDSTGHNTELLPQFTFEQQTPCSNVGPDAGQAKASLLPRCLLDSELVQQPVCL